MNKVIRIVKILVYKEHGYKSNQVEFVILVLNQYLRMYTIQHILHNLY
nr:MAG TPA: hypothetical protein [Caudoviricetes sp.]